MLVVCWSGDTSGQILVTLSGRGDIGQAVVSESANQVSDQLSRCGACEPPVPISTGEIMLSTDGNFTHSTVDRGANAGVAGREMRLISHYSPERNVDIEGFDHHLTTRLRLG